MSKYTTGEMAKLCGVTVRTVQYYDTRGVLVPSELSEGGRRLYSEDDLRRMKVICYLRELGLSIGVIAELLAEEHPENVVGLLLDQQMQALTEEVRERQEKLERIRGLRSGLQAFGCRNVESIGDIADMMENRKKMWKVYGVMLGLGIPMGLLEIGAVALWIVKGIWIPFAVWVVVDVIFAFLLSRYYYKKAAYICPECGKEFKPTFREMFWANHTPRTRKLTCPHCGHRGFCVEIYGGEDR